MITKQAIPHDWLINPAKGLGGPEKFVVKTEEKIDVYITTKGLKLLKK